MDEFDIPIFKKLYDLYRLLHLYQASIPKADRHTLWQTIQSNCLELLELVLLASQQSKDTKLPTLQAASVKLNVLRTLVRLSKDTKAIDTKKYIALQKHIDDVGRQLGGWLQSSKSPPPRVSGGFGSRL